MENGPWPFLGMFIMKQVLILFYFALIFSASVSFGKDEVVAMTFGPVVIAEERIPINLLDFKVRTYIQNDIIVKANFIKGSVQWIRTTGNLLSPRARLGIRIYKISPGLHLNHFGRSILPEQRKKYLYTELYVSLFNPGEVVLFEDGKQIGKVIVHALNPKKGTKTHLIDYSCSRHGLKITGLDNEYMSVGCSLSRTGKWGKERPRLEVSWASTNFRLLDKSFPPYVSILTKTSSVKTTVMDQAGRKRELTIEARVPKRIHRLRTALGFGPYIYEATQDNLKRSPVVAPALMIYANLGLTETSSIRGFDALVIQDSRFNNFGLYFAYELAPAFDGRVSLTALLGIQGLTFQYNKKQTPFSQIIYPQGFELLIRHFGWENYHFFYGMFISATDDYDYNNLWVRWGKKYFWEINYISWGYQGKTAAMWGLSVGIPFMQFM